jgi:hypothetical protein
VWDCIIQIEHFVWSCFCRSLVLILSVFHVRRFYLGINVFSLVLILRIPAYLGVKGDQFFSDLGFFFGTCFLYKLVCFDLYHVPISHKIVQFLCEIECNKFVCNKLVLNLVQTDLIQFEFSNCIRSICTKTNSNLLHINLLHSI